MYLLMLLATFMSAIYGFNLSARPDYDRDVARKKAMAIITRFMYHQTFALELAGRIKAKVNGHEIPSLMLPEDLIYGEVDDTDANQPYIMIYKQQHPQGAGEKKFYLREVSGESDSYNYMELGRKLIPGNEMATKLICLKRSMECEAGDTSDPVCGGATEMCDMTPHEIDDGSGNVMLTGSCCTNYTESRGGGYLVSFMKLDARWRSRVTGGISLDFWRAIEERKYNENVGVITWEGDHWLFRGKLLFLPAYRKFMDAWMEDNPDEIFPMDLKRMTKWKMPKLIFDEDFFVVNGDNLCANGCLFRIKSFI